MKAIQCLTLATLLLSGILSVAQQPQPSLGEVARQPKPLKKAARMITNDDILPRSQDPTSPSPGKSASGTAAAELKPGDAAPEYKDGPKAATSSMESSANVAEMKQRLKELDSDEKNLSSSLVKMGESAKSEEDPSRREVLENILAKRRESLGKAKAERSDINQKLDEQKKSEQR